jgi:3-oxoacyl-(acyl-carrier-protein) synthase
LRIGFTGIGKAEYFDSKYTENLLFGVVKLSNDELKIRNGLENQKDFSRNTLLAVQAFNEAIRNANLSKRELQAPRTGFISSKTVGGMCNTEELNADANLKSETSVLCTLTKTLIIHLE